MAGKRKGGSKVLKIDLAAAVRSRFQPLGGADVSIPAREPIRKPLIVPWRYVPLRRSRNSAFGDRGNIVRKGFATTMSYPGRGPKVTA
jgi:hypothetical protein